jgi:ribosomal protein L11 methyltransferase
MIQAYIKRGHAFLDVGTGTGILMIAAARLGADHVTGFDRDPSAAAAARYNLSLNGIDRERASVLCAAHPDLLKVRFDLVAINILPETIVAFMDGMARMLKPDGVLVCSGMIRGNTHRVTGAMKQGGLTPVRIFQKGAWKGIAARQS